MKTARRPFTCLQCRLSTAFSTPRISTIPRRAVHASPRLRSDHAAPPSVDIPSTPVRPTTAPKPTIDIKHIRQNPALYEQTCLERNYRPQAAYPARINALHEQWQGRQREARALRERANLIRRQLANPASVRDDEDLLAAGQALRARTRDELLDEARGLKAQLASIEADEARLQDEIQALALALPNLTSDATPRGRAPAVLGYINDHPEPAPERSDRVWRSHVHVGAELGLIDFAGAATASGWGWYYLLREGAELEQALVAYALAAATRAGWTQVSPPSMVYSHIAAACGFQPRVGGAAAAAATSSGDDDDGAAAGSNSAPSEPSTQIYSVAQGRADRARGRPELCLAGTAEIPLAGMRADAVLDEAELPCRRVAVSRCYRAEAGARGADTRGLYRVHEFTKVELFAWTAPSGGCAAGGATTAAGADEVFEEMVDLQTEILGSLGLHCRVLEMPSADLGASASRKNDIEAWFPSRARRDTVAAGGGSASAGDKKKKEAPGQQQQAKAAAEAIDAAEEEAGEEEKEEEEEGWGEVTSASICTDYQTRRLATRVKMASEGGRLAFPWTVNGTAMAVPRVLAAILENGWDEREGTVAIPEVLRPWMGGRDKIGPRHRLR